ncbi:MAG: hypothetical protein P8X96_12375 [Desulfobacteraceae bacterium]
MAGRIRENHLPVHVDADDVISPYFSRNQAIGAPRSVYIQPYDFALQMAVKAFTTVVGRDGLMVAKRLDALIKISSPFG